MDAREGTDDSHISLDPSIFPETGTRAGKNDGYKTGYVGILFSPMIHDAVKALYIGIPTGPEENNVDKDDMRRKSRVYNDACVHSKGLLRATVPDHHQLQALAYHGLSSQHAVDLRKYVEDQYRFTVPRSPGIRRSLFSISAEDYGRDASNMRTA
ncbi:hypothetical protein FQN57_004205 [Myotisia sp. PD_48]|nr:hypothetical protein FQN57_004205 [Myotisia sp. PD_48]